MAKNPTRGPNVIDFKDAKDNKDLCIFVQRKLAFAIAYKLKGVYQMVRYCLLLLFYLCVITTYIAVMQVINHEPTNHQNLNQPKLEKIEIPEFPPIGY